MPGNDTYLETDHRFLPAPAPLWNPWLDLRIDGRFRRSAPPGPWIDVPGFFAGDGSVGNVPGKTCKVRFTPFGATGAWEYEIRVWRGIDANLLPAAASLPNPTTTLLTQTSGVFTTFPAGMSAPGFQRTGPLRHVGQYRYQFENGEYFLKTGSGGPENFLAYNEFTGWASHGLGGCAIAFPPNYPSQGCSNSGWNFSGVSAAHRVAGGHGYGPHIPDWSTNDPTWTVQGQAFKGKGIIGALNYLSDSGVNSLYTLLMNLGGDSRDVAPFAEIGTDPCSSVYVPNPAAPNVTYKRTFNYSVARMREWNIVFELAMRKGIALDLVLSELELSNINWLGGASMSGGVAMSPERKLFLKQMVALFGHHLAIKWILQEENIDSPPLPSSPLITEIPANTCGAPGYTRAELQEMAAWIGSWDAYDHPITVHTTGLPWLPYDRILSDASYSGWLAGTSLQLGGERPRNPYFWPGKYSSNYNWYARWVRSLFGDQPVPIDVDENGHAFWGASRDGGSTHIVGGITGVPIWNNALDRRRRVLYDVLFAGAGLSWYYGAYPVNDTAIDPVTMQPYPLGGDHSVEDFTSRQQLYNFTNIARRLILTYPGTQTPRPNWWTYQPWDVGSNSLVVLGGSLTTNEDITVGFGDPFWTTNNPFVNLATDITPYVNTFGDLTDSDACDATYGRPRAFAQPDGDAFIYYPSFGTCGSGTIYMNRTWTAPLGTGTKYVARWFDPDSGAFSSIAPHYFYGHVPQSSLALPSTTNTPDWVLVIERIDD